MLVELLRCHGVVVDLSLGPGLVVKGRFQLLHLVVVQTGPGDDAVDVRLIRDLLGSDGVQRGRHHPVLGIFQFLALVPVGLALFRPPGPRLGAVVSLPRTQMPLPPLLVVGPQIRTIDGRFGQLPGRQPRAEIVRRLSVCLLVDLILYAEVVVERRKDLALNGLPVLCQEFSPGRLLHGRLGVSLIPALEVHQHGRHLPLFTLRQCRVLEARHVPLHHLGHVLPGVEGLDCRLVLGDGLVDGRRIAPGKLDGVHGILNPRPPDLRVVAVEFRIDMRGHGIKVGIHLRGGQLSKRLALGVVFESLGISLDFLLVPLLGVRIQRESAVLVGHDGVLAGLPTLVKDVLPGLGIEGREFVQGSLLVNVRLDLMPPDGEGFPEVRQGRPGAFHAGLLGQHLRRLDPDP
ncbi:MAG: hypothetical protein A4E67_01022 [Syntrophaceae bacterium PtaB.Bin038]|nr:MAG: hypothetical protein A4E67_01022 [Syntrophaceae bacterium PtaB.Bin038]